MRMIDDVRMVLAAPNRAGWPFIAGGAVLALVGLLVWHPLFWIGLAFALFCLYFFRDPERVTPPRAGVIVSAADGRVVSIEPAVPPAELGLGPAPRMRVAVFLSVLDVHINRVPASGTITRVAYHAGKFMSAAAEKASDENERNAVAMRLTDGRELAVVQIAGLVARRIICSLREGDAVQAGARMGLIRFGSRTDLYLPEGVRPLVSEGQYMIGGETVIAELGRAG